MEKQRIDLKQIKSKCLGLLVKRDHSRFELKQKLKRYYLFSDDDFKASLDWLLELGYLPDEAQLAIRWAKKLQSEGRGHGYIVNKLKSRGLIAPQKDEDAEVAAAHIFLEKKLRNRVLKDMDFKEKQKLGRALTSRGFSPSIVRDLLKC